MKNTFLTRFEARYLTHNIEASSLIKASLKLSICLSVRKTLPFYLASAKLSSLCCPHTVAQKTRLHEDQRFLPPKDKRPRIISNLYSRNLLWLSCINNLKLKYNEVFNIKNSNKTCSR